MRYRPRVDATQADIVRALRAYGCSVQSLAGVGAGCPDLLVGLHGRTHLVEVKDGAKSRSRRQLTPDEQTWIETWRGEEVAILGSVDQALRWAAGVSCRRI